MIQVPGRTTVQPGTVPKKIDFSHTGETWEVNFRNWGTGTVQVGMFC